MTVPKYGRVTPLQADMLGLGGEVAHWPMGQTTDDQRTSQMIASRENLRALTGRDFGYDLAAWHDYLMNSEEHAEEYTFPYAWAAVQRKILDLFQDPNRIRLVGMLEASGEQPAS